MMKAHPVVLLAAAALAASVLALPAYAQTSAQLQNYFSNSIGLKDEEIAGLRSGKAVAKILPSRTAAEIFVFGAVYIKAEPEDYVHLATDFDRLRQLPEFLAIGKFSNPPQLSDLEGFSFDQQDMDALHDCKPGHCEVQLPAQAMDEFQQSIHWDAPGAASEVNQLLHQRAVERLQAYEEQGNAALGTYYDKDHPTDVARRFAYMLSYTSVLPVYLPEFYRYLLDYPKGKSPQFHDTFYWAKVKFGLKPTLRVVHMIIMRGRSASEPAYAIAEKQLYSSHYFETALDLTFCIKGGEENGFYLIKEMGSEQAGLTGLKGSLVRKVAVDRTASSLQRSLQSVKTMLEAK